MPEPSAEASKPSKHLSGNKTMMIVVVVVIVFIVLTVIGYFVQRQLAEKAAETAIEQATGSKVDVSQDGEKITIETAEGKVTVGKNDIPDSFPSDITIYSGAEVISTTESSVGSSVVLKTSDPTSKVADFYKDDLKKNGWEIVSTITNEGLTLITARKGSKEVLITVTTDEEDEKTNVGIIVTNNQSP